MAIIRPDQYVELYSELAGMMLEAAKKLKALFS